MKVMPPTDFRTSRSNGQCVVKLLMRYLSIALIISPIASSLRIVPLSSHKVCNQHSLSRVGVIKQQRPPLVLVVRYNELYQSVTTRRARGTNVESLMSTNNNLGSFKRRVVEDRRSFFSSLLLGSLITFPISSLEAFGATDNDAGGVQVKLSGEAKKLYNEGRAKEMQGNVPAAFRIYSKVVKIAPKFVYGWSNLGNTQVALGDLTSAEESYSTSIDLCFETNEKVGDSFSMNRCDDLYLLFLNRGSVRLNSGMPKEALRDLEQAANLRDKPDPIVLQNRARARELNGLYAGADGDYSIAISMTSNEVAPFWLRAALVKFQLGETIGAFDLLRRVELRFPEAPEVRAALAAMLLAKGDEENARRKFLEIPDRQRLNFVDSEYMKKKIAWPPAMIKSVADVAKTVGNVS